MRLALKAVSWICAAVWVMLALWFFALNYAAFWAFMGGTLIALIPFLLTLGRSQAASGFWVCPDDWQGDLRECRRVKGKQPVQGVSVYYESNGVLKPWGKR